MPKEIIRKKPKEALSDDWGNAVTYSYMDELGRMWVTNEEYTTQVNFCPFSGTPAKLQIGQKPEVNGNTSS